jgi:hypothetical protein
MALKSIDRRHPEPEDEAMRSRDTLVRRFPQGAESKIFGGWGITL